MAASDTGEGTPRFGDRLESTSHATKWRVYKITRDRRGLISAYNTCEICFTTCGFGTDACSSGSLTLSTIILFSVACN